MARAMTFEKRRKALLRACAALEGMEAELWQAQGSELGPFMSLVDQLAGRAGAGRAAVLGEAIERGEAGEGTSGAHRWLREWAPSFHAGGSAQLVRVVEASRAQWYAGLRTALLAARLPVVNAACVVEEFERLRHRLHPDAHEAALECMVGLGETAGRRDIRAVRQQIVARYGHDGEFQACQDRLRERTSMSQPLADGGGLFDYHLVVDAEAKVVIEAAVGALSAPRPADGEPDRRPSGQRRLEALLDVVRRGVASADGVPTTTKAQLFVTMALADLRAGLNAGTVVGSAEAGTLLGPETVRRLCCDAGIVPVVLGERGELLDWGRRVRLFTDAQTRALWLRDGGCTFPGCTAPAAWADGHHLWHWADGGPSDLTNAALLCGRHHTLVHKRRYMGRVVEKGVEWDLSPGSYEHWLANRQAAAGDARARGSSEHCHDPSAGEPADAFDVWGEPVTRTEPAPPLWRP
jgi:Domain of unknown function (DUF222)